VGITDIHWSFKILGFYEEFVKNLGSQMVSIFWRIPGAIYLKDTAYFNLDSPLNDCKCTPNCHPERSEGPGEAVKTHIDP
jgi:hypothetical protein